MSRKKWWVGNDVSGSAPMPSPMLALTNLKYGSYVITANAGEGWPGSIGGFFLAALIQLETFLDQQYLFGHWFPYGNLLYQPSAGYIAFICADVGPTYVFSPFFTIPSSFLGKVFSIVGVLDPFAGKVRLYVNGAEVGSGTSTTGYIPGSQYSYMYGQSTLPNPIDPNTNKIYGAVYGNNAVPSAVNVQEWHRLCKRNRRVMEMPGVNNTGLWRINEDSGTTGVPDLIGSADLSTVYGTPDVIRTFSRFAA